MTEKTRSSKTGRRIAVFLVLAIVTGSIVLTTGFFVMQPVGALPEGVTVWYFRVGYDLPFVVSPDGYSLETVGSVSTLTRMTAASALIEVIEPRTIARLPYIRALYLVSTGGTEFVQ